MSTEFLLECTELVRAYGATPVLNGVNLRVSSGQIVALLGPSGCGKTTTLRLIAGFEHPQGGTITINGRVVAGNGRFVQPEDRRVGMVFQDYALFPHLNVRANVAFGLNGSPRERDRRAEDILHQVGLSRFADRMPAELSGGQQQRVALARALAPKPDVLLLDEPFSNLDAALRAQVREEVRTILRDSGITGIFVTHDQQEALSLADRVAVMFDGRVAQISEPQMLYNYPADPQVAAFVGEANFLAGESDGEAVICALGKLSLPSLRNEPGRKHPTGKVITLVRPEALRLIQAEVIPAGVARARIAWREFYGCDQRVGIVLHDGTPLVTRADSLRVYTVGEEVGVVVPINAPVVVYPSA
ncbi:ABC transporter ATP-binding protein [Kamptonema cortianum]|jgi:iron(III) transport system ATP-binding protein|nr:ABC transporter ATP-binding protein [Kamptonema cortianum]